MIRAIVGSGGKTSYIKEYAKELVKQGKRVFVTTSTHMMKETYTLVTDDADYIIEELEKTNLVMAGQDAGEKIKALSCETYCKVCQAADEVLIEADGSRQMPLKFPAENEPVIYGNVEEITVLTGLHSLGRKAKDVVHRLPLAQEKMELNEDSIIEAKHVQELLRKGYLERMNISNIKVTNDGSLYQRVISKLIEENIDVTLVKKEWFQTQPKLIICGGGHVAYELAKMASFLDFHIKVIDDRLEFANAERFPEVNEVICDSFENLKKYLEPDSYYVVVTRGHQADYECVEKILHTKYQYLGMIGSRKKVAATFERLENAGFSKEGIGTIHAPIGLKISANTPAEIAISILAEIIQEKNSRHSSFISNELSQVKEKGILCIITKKTGSSPRGEGTMMFIGEKGNIETIGGGAVEHAVIQDAKEMDRVTLKEYQLDNKESANLGMICGGSNEILFIPL